MSDKPASRAARALLMRTMATHAARWGDDGGEADARLRLGEGRVPRSPDVAYVAIERAVVLGEPGRAVEGRLYRQTKDGSLIPLDGAELSSLYERYPEFLKAWRLKDDE